mgnify:FL=1
MTDHFATVTPVLDPAGDSCTDDDDRDGADDKDVSGGCDGGDDDERVHDAPQMRPLSVLCRSGVSRIVIAERGSFDTVNRRMAEPEEPGRSRRNSEVPTVVSHAEPTTMRMMVVMADVALLNAMSRTQVPWERRRRPSR